MSDRNYKFIDPELRFRKRCVAVEETGCLELRPRWGTKTGHLHPTFFVKGRGSIRASHYALELAGRPLPEGLFALHRCDNPRCVNPDHLYAGTQAQNMRDAVVRCRGLGRKKGYQHAPETKAKIGNAVRKAAEERREAF